MKQNLLSIAFVLTLLVLLTSCKSVTGPTPPPSGNAQVTVTVIGDSQPIAGLTVSLRSNFSIVAVKTDGSGKAGFQNIPYGTYGVSTDSTFGFSPYQGTVSIDAVTVTITATLSPINDVILDRILDDSQGQLSPGATVFYPTTLRFQGRYRVANRSAGSTYQVGVSFFVNGGFGDGTTQPKMGSSLPMVMTDNTWELFRNVIGLPCQSVNNGPPTCFDHTDQLQIDLAEFPAATGIARQGPFSYTLKYVVR